MHLLIPFAAPLPEAGREPAVPARLPPAALPHLQKLLCRWTEVARDTGDEWSLSPPHERALARGLGWPSGDGLLPWAARQALADGIDVGGAAWGLLTPSHWLLGTDQVSLIDPQGLMLDAASARALFDSVLPLFTSDGYALHFAAPQRWYLAHDSLATLATASLDRVIGRNVDAWLGHDPALRPLRRLQSEVQMLLYTHPVNDLRQARGLLPVNSFWLSGCGRLHAASSNGPTVDDRLRGPALAGDGAAWARAWQTLDEGPMAALLAASPDPQTSLTLCGERSSATFAPARQGLLQNLSQHLLARWRAPAVAALLETL